MCVCVLAFVLDSSLFKWVSHARQAAPRLAAGEEAMAAGAGGRARRSGQEECLVEGLGSNVRWGLLGFSKAGDSDEAIHCCSLHMAEGC